MQGTNRSGEGEGRRACDVCDPVSELRLGGRENRKANIINGIKKKKKKNFPAPFRTAELDDMSTGRKNTCTHTSRGQQVGVVFLPPGTWLHFYRAEGPAFSLIVDLHRILPTPAFGRLPAHKHTVHSY